MYRRRTVVLLAPLLALVTACGSDAVSQTLPTPSGMPSSVKALPTETIANAAAQPGVQHDVKLPAAPPDAEPATPALLAGAWTVVAEGEDLGTVLALSEQELTIWRPCGAVNGEWNGNALGMLVTDLDGGEGACDIDSPTWLARATTAVTLGRDRLLLDKEERTVARLGAGAVITQPDNDDVDYTDEEVETPKVTPALRTRSQPTKATSSWTSAATAKQLVGTWRPLSADADGPSITFKTNGEWRGGDGCNSLKGAWAVGERGAFLATSTVFTLKACEKPYEEGDVLADVVYAGFAGSYLVLYDQKARKLSRLHRV